MTDKKDYVRYRNYTIDYSWLEGGEPLEYEWVSDDYDGAPDAPHSLCGVSPTLEDSMKDIDDQLIDYLCDKNDKLTKKNIELWNRVNATKETLVDNFDSFYFSIEESCANIYKTVKDMEAQVKNIEKLTKELNPKKELEDEPSRDN